MRAGFGASTSRSSSWGLPSALSPLGYRFECTKPGKAGPLPVGLLRAGAGLAVAVHAALGTQPEAIGPTERRERQLEDTGIVSKGLKIEPVVGHRVLDLGIRVVGVDLTDPG